MGMATVVAEVLSEARNKAIPYFTDFVPEYAVYSVAEARFVEIVNEAGKKAIEAQAEKSGFFFSGYIIPLELAKEMHQYKVQTDAQKFNVAKYRTAKSGQ